MDCRVAPLLAMTAERWRFSLKCLMADEMMLSTDDNFIPSLRGGQRPTRQSIAPTYEHKRYGLPRRCAPRNDGAEMVTVFTAARGGVVNLGPFLSRVANGLAHNWGRPLDSPAADPIFRDNLPGTYCIACANGASAI